MIYEGVFRTSTFIPYFRINRCYRSKSLIGESSLVQDESVSKTPSTSTQTPLGSEFALTANLVCYPISPNTSTKRSEAP